MTWERLHYICRRYAVSDKNHLSIKAAFEQINHEPSTNIYGVFTASESPALALFNKISAIESVDRAKYAARVFGNIDLSNISLKLRNYDFALKYLACLAVLFAVVSYIYRFKVGPNFIEVFENFNIQAPPMFELFMQYWPIFMVCSFFWGSVLVLMVLNIKKIASLRWNRESSLFSRILIPQSLKDVYDNVDALMHFPLGQTKSENRIANHLSALADSKLDLEKELELLINKEVKTLIGACEAVLSKVTLVVSIFIMISIYFFLSSAYLPIFKMGAMV